MKPKEEENDGKLDKEQIKQKVKEIAEDVIIPKKHKAKYELAKKLNQKMTPEEKQIAEDLLEKLVKDPMKTKEECIKFGQNFIPEEGKQKYLDDKKAIDEKYAGDYEKIEEEHLKLIETYIPQEYRQGYDLAKSLA